MALLSAPAPYSDSNELSFKYSNAECRVRLIVCYNVSRVLVLLPSFSEGKTGSFRVGWYLHGTFLVTVAHLRKRQSDYEPDI